MTIEINTKHFVRNFRKELTPKEREQITRNVESISFSNTTLDYKTINPLISYNKQPYTKMLDLASQVWEDVLDGTLKFPC